MQKENLDGDPRFWVGARLSALAYQEDNARHRARIAELEGERDGWRSIACWLAAGMALIALAEGVLAIWMVWL